MNPLGWWLNSRAVRRFEQANDRLLAARFELYEQGRFAEYAQALQEIEPDLREPRVVGAGVEIVHLRIARCAALVRAGRPELAETEAAQLTAVLAADGPAAEWMVTRLRHCLQHAHRDEDQPPLAVWADGTGWIRFYDEPTGTDELATQDADQRAATTLLRAGIHRGWLTAADHDRLTAWAAAHDVEEVGAAATHIERRGP